MRVGRVVGAVMATAIVAAVAAGSAESGSQAARGYTVSNTGGSKPVAVGLRRYFAGRTAKLYLLGQVRGVAFYRVQPTPTYTCWAAGTAVQIGAVTVVGCPNVIGAYPLQFDYTALSRPPRSHYTRIAGIAVDGAVKMAIKDSAGKVIATAPVVHNLFVFQPPLPTILGRLVALDARGQVLQPHPAWGRHQTLGRG